MRIRSVRPAFWTAEDIADLSVLARLLYIGLWLYCDDEGRGVDSMPLIMSSLFPHDIFSESSVSPQTVSAAMGELVASGHIVRYVDDSGVKALCIPTFTKYQKPNRPLASMISPPSLNAHEQLTEHSVSPQCRSSRSSSRGVVEVDGEVEGDARERAESSPPAPTDDGFDRLWAAYGFSANKKEARTAWTQLTKTRGFDPEHVIAQAASHALRYKARETVKGTKPPALAVWLRNERWANDPDTIFSERDLAGPMSRTDQMRLSVAAPTPAPSWVSDRKELTP